MFENLTGRLPSLNALRAFEAMARTGGATRAAAELNVTHSAVSRQVKALEAALGARLFEGPRHDLRLTPQGRQLAPALTAAFDGMDRAVARTRGEGRDLHVAVNASLSVKWLMPRLSRFEQAHPGIRLHLGELPSHAVRQRGADLVLRLLDDAGIAELGAQVVARNATGPVIAPSRAGDDPRTAVLTAPRIAARTHLQAWTDWAARTGRGHAGAPDRVVAHLHFAQDAVTGGLGAAVLPWVLVAAEIEAGRLAAPLGFAPAGGALALIQGAGEPSASRRAFARWLVAEAAAMPAPPPPVAGP